MAATDRMPDQTKPLPRGHPYTVRVTMATRLRADGRGCLRAPRHRAGPAAGAGNPAAALRLPPLLGRRRPGRAIVRHWYKQNGERARACRVRRSADRSSDRPGDRRGVRRPPSILPAGLHLPTAGHFRTGRHSATGSAGPASICGQSSSTSYCRIRGCSRQIMSLPQPNAPEDARSRRHRVRAFPEDL